MIEIVQSPVKEGFPDPRFKFFQSVTKTYNNGREDHGLVVGIEWYLNGEDSAPFNFEDGRWEYSVCTKSDHNGEFYIFSEAERDIAPTSEEFYPDIPRPSSSPLFKVGDVFDKPEFDCKTIIYSCQWGHSDSKGCFNPGWNYLVYSVDKYPEKDDLLYWDTNGLRSEAQLVELRTECDADAPRVRIPPGGR